jgi:hypothetical protein
MAQYEQLTLFDPTPYIISQLAVDNIKLAIVKGAHHQQFHDVQFELEFPAEADDKSGDDLRLAA